MREVYALPVPLPLARATVDRAAERRTDTEWLDKTWSDEATRVLLVGDGAVPVRDGDLAFVLTQK